MKKFLGIMRYEYQMVDPTEGLAGHSAVICCIFIYIRG